MDGAELVGSYLRLGLRFDRLVEGFVDAYTGDPVVIGRYGAGQALVWTSQRDSS